MTSSDPEKRDTQEPDVQKPDAARLDIDPRSIIVFATPTAATADTLARAIQHADGRDIEAATPQEFIEAVDYWFPVGALVDAAFYTADPKTWQQAIRRIKLRPHTRAVPIILFGDLAGEGVSEGVGDLSARDDPEAARTALGVEAVWRPIDTADDLPARFQRLIDPPTVYPEGWDDGLADKAKKGVEEFNAGEYYEQHEWLEHAWMDETRPIREMYQGILQVGVGFFHIEEGNWPGALKMLRRGLPRLRALPPVCQSIDIAALRDAAETIHREVTALGRDRLHEFDVSRFPKIRLVEGDAEYAAGNDANDA